MLQVCACFIEEIEETFTVAEEAKGFREWFLAEGVKSINKAKEG
jgi:hypothetical protein